MSDSGDDPATQDCDNAAGGSNAPSPDGCDVEPYSMRSCLELLTNALGQHETDQGGVNPSWKADSEGLPDGWYNIDANCDGKLERVYCDMTSDLGGWTKVYESSYPEVWSRQGWGLSHQGGGATNDQYSILSYLRYFKTQPADPSNSQSHPVDDEATDSTYQLRLEVSDVSSTAARENAHAPYSGYRVGAALLDDDGRIFAGCNVENRTFGLTICAERTAMVSAVAAGATGFTALAVITISAPPAAPCGQCRDSLAEFGVDLPVLMVNTAGERRETSLAELLPEPFVLPSAD